MSAVVPHLARNDFFSYSYIVEVRQRYERPHENFAVMDILRSDYACVTLLIGINKNEGIS